MIQLRPYQMDAVSRVRLSYRDGRKAPLLVLPTGGGKTVVFTYIANAVAQGQRRIVILVHRDELIRQTSAALQRFGVRHGIIAAKYTGDVLAPVQIASVQTLVRRVGRWPWIPDQIVVDEAHHTNASTYRAILDAWASARVLGVTATPVRTDGTGLGLDAGGLFDDLIVGPTTADLIADGYLIQPIVYAPANALDLSGVKLNRDGDFNREQLSKRVDQPKITGDAVTHYKRIADGLPAVAFCVSVGHAQHVANEFRAAGYRSFAVSGDMDFDDRRRILHGLTTGDVQVVTSCDLISEGTDIPVVSAGIMLRPTQSLGLYLQQAGRILRPTYAPGFDLSTREARFAAIEASGKSLSFLIDHVGNALRFGLPTDDRDWALDGEKKAKSRGAITIAPSVSTCPTCFAAFATTATSCPACGYRAELFDLPKVEAPPKVAAGELIQITAEEAARIKADKQAEVGNARTLEELERVGRSRGYKPNWALRIWEAREMKAAQRRASQAPQGAAAVFSPAQPQGPVVDQVAAQLLQDDAQAQVASRAPKLFQSRVLKVTIDGGRQALVVMRKTDDGWKCVAAPSAAAWMADQSADVIKAGLTERGWAHEWMSVQAPGRP